MGRFFETIHDLNAGLESIRQRPYGMIELQESESPVIHLRPWPKLISGMETWWDNRWGQARKNQKRCLLYYNQPAGHGNYLALAYVLTGIHTSYSTFIRTLAVLDFVAYAKRSDAILAEVFNKRLSDRFMVRVGWEPQNLNNRKRHWIKRFYGSFPSNPLFDRLGLVHPAESRRLAVAAAIENQALQTGAANPSAGISSGSQPATQSSTPGSGNRGHTPRADSPRADSAANPAHRPLHLPTGNGPAAAPTPIESQNR